MNTKNQILETIKNLNIEQQYKLLEFIKSLNSVKKVASNYIHLNEEKTFKNFKHKKHNPLLGMKIIYEKPYEPICNDMWEASK